MNKLLHSTGSFPRNSRLYKSSNGALSGVSSLVQKFAVRSLWSAKPQKPTEMLFGTRGQIVGVKQSFMSTDVQSSMRVHQ